MSRRATFTGIFFDGRPRHWSGRRIDRLSSRLPSRQSTDGRTRLRDWRHVFGTRYLPLRQSDSGSHHGSGLCQHLVFTLLPLGVMIWQYSCRRCGRRSKRLCQPRLKIAAVVEALVPVLCREYVAKLLTDLGERLQNAAPDAYNEALAKVVGDGQPQYRLGLLVATKASEQLRLELYGKLDRVPLLRYRLYAMRRAFGTSDSLNETIQAHGRRVAWHLRRVYRSRNLLLHAGEVAPYNDSMVENLHSYFHQTLDTLEKLFSTEPSPVSLDAAFLQIRLDHLAHMRILQAEKKADTDESNLSAFLFA
mgnify:CR=1 FL=1